MPSFFLPFSLQNVKINPSSISYQMWKDIPVPFYLSVHFFEVLNPKEVLQGAKPVLSQRGPYVYRSGTTCGQPGLSLGTARLLGCLLWQQDVASAGLVRAQGNGFYSALIALILLKAHVGTLVIETVRLELWSSVSFCLLGRQSWADMAQTWV